MSKKNYWKILSDDILQKKLLVFFVILTTVLCFGFTITNFSIGVDDCARNYYFYSNGSGSMIQQGRLLHVLLNLLTRSIEFIPFFTDFVGAALFAFSALLYCGLFQLITNNKLSLTALISFACVYISSSIIAEKYIYHLDVIATMLSYCFSAIALMYAYRFTKENHWGVFAKAVASLMIAIASYESYMFLYFCGVFSVIILDIVINESSKTFLNILIDGIKYAAILLVSLVLYYGLVYVVQRVTGQYGIFTRYSIWSDSTLGIWTIFKTITQKIYVFFIESINCRYIPILVFCFFSFLGFALSAFLSWRRKNIWLLVCFFAFWIGNFFIHYVVGSFMSRAAQTFCYFVGFVVLLLVETISFHVILKRAMTIAVILLVFIQSADMSRWFYNDYVRYQKETFVIDTIATELIAEYDVSKPVVFTNSPENEYLKTALYPGSQVNGNSMIYWAITAFEDKTLPFVSEIFHMHGYDFIVSPTEEQFNQAYIEAEAMPPWPQDGCIQEFDDFIVINFS